MCCGTRPSERHGRMDVRRSLALGGMDSLALAEKIGNVLIIWCFKENHWVRTTLAAAFKDSWAKAARNTAPIVLLFKGGHYTWLKAPPNESVLEAWLRESKFSQP